MGWGRKTIITVDSVIYNMAGPEDGRSSYLKMLALKNILQGTDKTLGESLVHGYLYGPGIKARSFYRWCQRKYGAVGLPIGNTAAIREIPSEHIEAYIRHMGWATPEQEIWIQSVEADRADFVMWADRWVLQNYPERYDTEWTADYEEPAIIIMWADGLGESTFEPDDFDAGSTVVRIQFTVVSPPHTGEEVLVETTYPAVFTAPVDYSVGAPYSENITRVLHTAIRTVVSYSDAREGSDTTVETPVSTVTYTEDVVEYSKEEHLGQLDPLVDADVRLTTTEKHIVGKRFWYDWGVPVETVVEIEPGVFETTLVYEGEEKEEDSNVREVWEREDTLFTYSKVHDEFYRVGGGFLQLDYAVGDATPYGNFFPLLPIRLNNRMLGTYPNWWSQSSKDEEDEVFSLTKKAYRKLTGSSFKKLQDNIGDNKDIGEIDYAYVVMGVSLNVLDNSCREYIYRLFDRFFEASGVTQEEMDAFYAAEEEYAEAYDAWEEWRLEQRDGGDGTPPPVVPVRPQAPSAYIDIKNSGEFYTNYDVRISWDYITKGVGEGLGRSDAKKGRYWLEKVPPQPVKAAGMWPFGKTRFKDIPKIRICWQETEDNYRYIEVANLTHRNYIHKGHSVTTTGTQALEDGEESKFVVPLHWETYREMSLVDSTQMATANVLIVFNCYTERKQKWYETTLFKIIVIVVIIAITVMTANPAAIGLLGANAAVGAAVGASAAAAAMVGAAINAIAALIVTTLITKLATKIFGPVLGPIIAMIANIAMMNVAGAMQSAGSMAMNWSNMMNIANIMQLASAGANAYGNYMQGKAAKNIAKAEAYKKEGDKKISALKDSWAMQTGGAGPVQMGMSWFLGGEDSARDSTTIMIESHDGFIARTLMTGTDMAHMSLEMVSGMADMTLSLPSKS